jgi:mono/diheme cytochrome c family protein
MKKVFALSLFIVLIAVACHKKAVPVASTPTATTEPAVAAADPALVEAGKSVFATKCTKCHPAKVVENYTTERWTGILKSMIPKAKLDETEAAQVTAYVNANAKK